MPASEVLVSNMALSHIGAKANVSAISPPDGSVESAHCARFFAQARQEMLELGAWQFSLKRALLAEATNESDVWAYAYVVPSDCMRALRILRASAGQLTVFNQDTVSYDPTDDGGAPFTREGDVLFTNEPEAVLVYVRDVSDTTKWTASFAQALSYRLAGYLAGPIVKGTEGVKLASAMFDMAEGLARRSATASANAGTTQTAFTPSSISARR